MIEIQNRGEGFEEQEEEADMNISNILAAMRIKEMKGGKL